MKKEPTGPTRTLTLDEAAAEANKHSLDLTDVLLAYGLSSEDDQAMERRLPKADFAEAMDTARKAPFESPLELKAVQRALQVSTPLEVLRTYMEIVPLKGESYNVLEEIIKPVKDLDRLFEMDSQVWIGTMARQVIATSATNCIRPGGVNPVDLTAMLRVYIHYRDDRYEGSLPTTTAAMLINSEIIQKKVPLKTMWEFWRVCGKVWMRDSILCDILALSDIARSEIERVYHASANGSEARKRSVKMLIERPSE